jgi:hypothetical protein
MRRLKKVTAVFLLAAVMSMSASLALAGQPKLPGQSTTVTVYGAIETPGFISTILITASLIM